MPNEEWRTGTTGYYDKETGERKATQFRYKPAEPPSPLEMLSKVASRAYETLPLKDAEKATAAAIQFQGMRGYQQALKNGDPASKALAQWGPLMFYQKPQTIAPMIKATTPAAVKPNLRSVGGSLVQVNPDGSVNEIYKAPPKPPQMISPNSALAASRDPMTSVLLGPEMASNLVNIAKSGIVAPQLQTATQEAALALPTAKEQLAVGKVYNTKRGAARWDGKQFVKL